jgi:hypothetical protein
MVRTWGIALVLLCLGIELALANTPGSASASTLQVDRPQFHGLSAYYGELHQHTGYSLDGCGLPEEAIAAARGRGNDFLALTEHNNSFIPPEIGSLERGCRIDEVDPAKWQALAELAERYTQDGHFVLLRGYEHTRDQGHLNVFNSDHYASPVALDDFYSWLAGQPPEVYAQFNHPLPLEWEGQGDLESLRFFPPVAPKVRLFETAEEPPFDLLYPVALRRGWRVSAVGYGDGHIAQQAGTRRYGVFAPAADGEGGLTRASLDEALRGGRAFGNTDGQLAVALVAISEDGSVYWMGSSPPGEDQVVFEAYAADRTGDTIERIELLRQSGQDGVVRLAALSRAEGNPVVLRFEPQSLAPGDAFYLHVVDSAGDHAWSGSLARPLGRRLETNPATLAFTASAGSIQERMLLLAANDGADLAWEVQSGPAWAVVEPSSGEHLPARLTVRVSHEELASGRHVSALRIHVMGDSHVGALVGLQTNVGVGGNPDLALSPRVVHLTASLDRPQVSGALGLVSADAATLWFAASTVPWLTLQDLQGIVPVQDATLALPFAIDFSGRAPGDYTGHVVVMSGATVRVSEVHCSLLPAAPRRVTLQADLAGYVQMQDTYVDAWALDTTNGGAPNLQVRGGGAQVTLLRFELPTLSASTEVFSATLSLYAVMRSMPARLHLDVYRAREAWSEAEATWQHRLSGQPWAEGGVAPVGDTAQSEVVAQAVLADLERWVALDVTSPVREWIAAPDTNHGLVVAGQPRTNVLYTFYSSESAAAQADLRPRLDITYGEALPEPTASPTPEPSSTPSRSRWLPLVLKSD